ncbi:hypothetical protein LQG66_30945 [Bradyrhizobium ontarionense]|uniref:Uncharacterized protein n=1 Tax=Bradyrhizobium ontarionense TaxID=2898149 RepID=A0ABY3RME6_9BRAD|nr:hypothetical protein [Bradyrhizobium sp. A19]UFZ08656.1 hypothetical protein LQG66_30945 [Bradyrhizobium sp. A19]
MLELDVAALLSHLKPSVPLESRDDVPTVHGVYLYTRIMECQYSEQSRWTTAAQALAVDRLRKGEILSEGFLCEFASPDDAATIDVEDDGRVAYAYWLDAGGAIRGDVWLYNRCLAPEQPEWDARDAAPYANPAPFVDGAIEFSPPTSASCFTVEWLRVNADLIARVLVSEMPVAQLKDGSKPGWSRLAAKDGPLALCLTD